MGTIDKAKTGIEIVGEVVRLAGDDPNVKQAASQLSKSALTITKTINNALLPLAAVNFAFDKARRYFAEKFEDDLKEKAAKIPPEDIIEPRASVAGPALQGLAFAHEEPNLRDLFLELLAGAMDKRRAAMAHPAFVEILRQLESEEARLLKTVLKADVLPIACLVLKMKDKPGQVVIKRHILDMRNEATKVPSVIARLAAMVDNWVRLGLITVDYGSTLADDAKYGWLATRPELVNERASRGQGEAANVDWQKGIAFPTALGKQFAQAIGVVS